MSVSNRRMDFDKKISDFVTLCKDIFNGTDNERKNKLMDAIDEINLLKGIYEKKENGTKRKLSDGLQNCFPIKKTRSDEISVDLPNELWQKVFSYLPTRTILGKVARVCKRFYEITKNPSILSNVTLKKIYSEDSDDYDAITNLLKRSSCLNEVSIIDCDRYEELIETTIKSNRKLNTLKLITYKRVPDFSEDDNVAEIAEIKPELSLKCITKIEKFRKGLSNLHLKVSLSEKVVKQVLVFENLKSLTIEDVDLRLRPRHFVLMANNFKHLEELVLHVRAILQDPEISVVDNLKTAMRSFFKSQSHSLKSLWIKEADPKVVSLFANIDECKNLERFSIAPFGRQEYSIWNSEDSLDKNEVEALCCLKNLKCLDVYVNDSLPPNDESLWKTLFTKCNFEKLEELCFGPSIDEEGLKFLPDCPKLRELDLSESNLELNDNGMRALLVKFPVLKKLNILTLQDAELSEKLLCDIISCGVYVETDIDVMDRLDDYSNYSIRVENVQNEMDWCTSFSTKNEWVTWNIEEVENDDDD